MERWVADDDFSVVFEKVDLPVLGAEGSFWEGFHIRWEGGCGREGVAGMDLGSAKEEEFDRDEGWIVDLG